MTVLDKLESLGPKCPCGGELRCADNIIYCMECGGEMAQYGSIVDVWTAWYVVSGGPIPGEIAPPDDQVVLVSPKSSVITYPLLIMLYTNNMWLLHGIWEEPGFISDFWYFIGRNPEKIKAFLESEVVE